MGNEDKRSASIELLDYIQNPDVWLHMRRHSGYDWNYFEIIIEEMEEYGDNQILNISWILEDILEKNKKNVLKESQWVFKLSFNDFNSNPKALYDIEEVRVRVKKLIEKIPYFFYFFHPDSILLLTMCSLDYKETWAIWKFGDHEALEKFSLYHFWYMNNIFDLAWLDNEDNDRVSKEILSKIWWS